MRVKVPHVHIRAAGHHKKNARWRGEKELQNWKIKKMLENKKHKICQLKIDKILLTKRKNIQSLGIEKKMKYCWKIGNMLSLPRLWVDFETMVIERVRFAVHSDPYISTLIIIQWDDGYWVRNICGPHWTPQYGSKTDSYLSPVGLRVALNGH